MAKSSRVKAIMYVAPKRKKRSSNKMNVTLVYKKGKSKKKSKVSKQTMIDDMANYILKIPLLGNVAKKIV